MKLIKSTLSLLLVISLTVIFFTSLTGCTATKNAKSTPDEITNPTKCTNHLYWKDINVEVIDSKITRRALKYYTIVLVYSDEYNLEKTLYASGRHYLSKGDYITAELYTWKNDETGEINDREIHCITRWEPLSE